MQAIQQENGLASGDNKEKATSDKIIAAVEALIAGMKSYQHAWMIDVNLVGLLKDHFLAGYEFTSVMLNNTLMRSKRTKASLITREGNPTGIYKARFSQKKNKGSRITGYYLMEPGELVHSTQDGKEWYNSIKKDLKAKSNTTQSAKQNLTEAELLQPRKGQETLVDSDTGNRSEESESEGDDAEERAGELKKEAYFDSLLKPEESL
jgi:hypothetical protein